MGIIEEKIFCKGFQDSDVKLGAEAYNLIKITDVYDKIQNKVPKNKFVVNSCFCMKEMW